MTVLSILHPLIDRSSRETMGLLVEARNYAVGVRTPRDRDMPRMTRLIIACETMRVVSRLAMLTAWLMERRDSIAARVEDTEDTPLHMNATCMDFQAMEDDRLPMRLRSLLERSYRLYVRMARLEIDLRQTANRRR